MNLIPAGEPYPQQRRMPGQLTDYPSDMPCMYAKPRGTQRPTTIVFVARNVAIHTSHDGTHGMTSKLRLNAKEEKMEMQKGYKIKGKFYYVTYYLKKCFNQNYSV